MICLKQIFLGTTNPRGTGPECPFVATGLATGTIN